MTDCVCLPALCSEGSECVRNAAVWHRPCTVTTSRCAHPPCHAYSVSPKFNWSSRETTGWCGWRFGCGCLCVSPGLWDEAVYHVGVWWVTDHQGCVVHKIDFFGQTCCLTNFTVRHRSGYWNSVSLSIYLSIYLCNEYVSSYSPPYCNAPSPTICLVLSLSLSSLSSIKSDYIY